ncbi:MAG: TROVE domain-containing protein [Nitrososphaerota archaeon]
MASVNQKIFIKTHEGGKAKYADIKEQFLRTLNSCLLWEDGFYEDGEEIGKRLFDLTILSAKNDFRWTIEQIIKARKEIGLRHAPLWCLVALASIKMLSKENVRNVLMRPDDATELLALYWKNGNMSIAASIKKGLAMFFQTLDEYRLAKYGTRDGTVKLRDILFLSHAKPSNEEQAKLWKRFITGELEEPETWEHMLSAGNDKKETFKKLISDGKLGSLALIRNLRNMVEVNVDGKIIIEAIKSAKTERIFPYQIMQAAKYAPRFESQLEDMLYRCIKEYGKLNGTTIFLIDHSGSMSEGCGGKKSEMNRYDAAKSIAVILREICEDARIFLFNDSVKELPARRGFGLIEAMGDPHGGTRLGYAIQYANTQQHDRLIVITDEQTQDSVTDPVAEKAYLINPSSNKNGVGYGKWIHIDGFSTNVIDFILGCEINDRA